MRLMQLSACIATSWKEGGARQTKRHREAQHRSSHGGAPRREARNWTFGCSTPTGHASLMGQICHQSTQSSIPLCPGPHWRAARIVAPAALDVKINSLAVPDQGCDAQMSCNQADGNLEMLLVSLPSKIGRTTSCAFSVHITSQEQLRRLDAFRARWTDTFRRLPHRHSTHVGCTLSKTLVDSPTAFSTHIHIPCAPSATCLHL